MNDSQSLDLLESRIEVWESQILSKYPIEETKKQYVVDTLLQTHLMISSALSGRETVTKLLHSLSIINDLLDPIHADRDLEIDEKRRYILELYPSIKELAVEIATCNDLIHVADSEAISNLSSLQDVLNKQVSAMMPLYDENRRICEKVHSFLQQYRDILTSIKMMFARLDIAVTELENAVRSKIVVEE